MTCKIYIVKPRQKTLEKVTCLDENQKMAKKIQVTGKFFEFEIPLFRMKEI